jgi:peptide/nickel transport system substrate-binding protein
MAAAALLAIFVAGCSGDRREARRGGTLVVGEISPYESLNPMRTSDAHARDIYSLVFLSLLDENDDFMTFEPRLAESWRFSPDRLELTFTLRNDVLWSDGTPCTARDVEATFRAQIDTMLAWSGRHLKQHITDVRALDDRTVVYRFTHAYPYQLMDANDGPILPRQWLEGKSAEQIRGASIEEMPYNGPFHIGQWVRGQSLTLLPNDRYYERGKPYLERVVFKIVPDQVNLLTQLRGGEIDCMEAPPPMEVEPLRNGDYGLEVFNFPARAYGYIGWNNVRKPFDSPAVRRALTMAINRRLILDNLYYGLAEECTSPFISQFWAYDTSIRPLPYDPAEAKRILAAEGFADTDGDGWLDRGGERFEFELMTNQGNQIRNDIQVMVQEQLREIGVKVDPLILEWTVMLEKYKACDFDAVVNAWRVGTKVDLAPIWSCEARREGGYNRIGYCNPTVDSLNAAATAMLDFGEARPLFFRAQELIYEDQPYTFLYYTPGLLVLHSRFKGARPDAISMYHNLHEWYVGDAAAKGARDGS